MNETQLLDRIANIVDNGFKRYCADIRLKIASEQDTFKKVEQIMWNYPLFKKIIADKEEQIHEISEHGIRTKSKSIIEYQSTSVGIEQGLSMLEDTAQDVIASLKEDISWLLKTLTRIDIALDSVRQHEDYYLIEAYYFDNITREKLSEIYKMNVKTISNKKNKLLKKLALYLFPDKVTAELFD